MPIDEELLIIGNYDKFLGARSRLTVKELLNYLRSLYPGYYGGEKRGGEALRAEISRST